MGGEKLPGSRPDPSPMPQVENSPDAELFGRMEADAGMGLATSAEEGEPGADIDPLSGPAFGPTFLEKLLFAIIAANPVSSGETPRQRLNAAMKALVGRKSTGNPPADDPDDKALLWMKSEQLRLRRLGQKQSDRSLAIQAAGKFLAGFEIDKDMSPADRLREKFSGVYERKQANGRQLDVPRTLAYRATQHDYLPESVEAQMLEQIAQIMAGAGVRITLPD